MRESESASKKGKKDNERYHGVSIGKHEVIIWNVNKNGSSITPTERIKGRVKVATINAHLFAQQQGEHVPEGKGIEPQSDVVLKGSREATMAAKRVDLAVTGVSILAKHFLPTKTDFDDIIKRGDKAAIVKP